MLETVFTNGQKKMGEVIELVKEDLAGVHTGRAKPALVEGILVEAYEGTKLEIRELASISAPDSHSLVIKPWDANVLEGTAKAIQDSGLQLSPVVDKDIVRIKIPALTEERRQELVKLIKQKLEAGRAMLRQVRIEMKREIDNQKDEAGVSEDDIHGMYKQLQELMDEYNEKLEKMEKEKESELMTI